MPEKRYIVELSEVERDSLRAVVKSNGRIARQKRTRAQVLLKVDQGEHGPGWTDQWAAEAFDLTVRGVEKLRQRLLAEGFERTLEGNRPATSVRARRFDAKGEAELLALATSAPPEGRARWTLRLLAREVVRLEIVDTVSHETVRQVLKKGISSPIARRAG